MMIVNICKTNLQGSYTLFRLTKVTQRFLAAYAFIQVWPAQITQSFKLCIFLKTITPENLKPNKKEQNT